MIKLVIKEHDELYKEVAQEYVNMIKANPKMVLGLATGSSPVPLYKELIKAYENSEISFEDIKTFNLDEYIGLDINNKNSYHTFMRKNLFNLINIKEENINFPPNTEDGIEAFENKLSESDIDVQLLGIGSNGHIAFNEPGASFDSRTRVVDLADKTISDNSRFFEHLEEVPTQAISMGLANIMETKKIILIACGNAKANIIKEIFTDEEVTESIPATILKKHKNVTFYVDYEAAKYLDN